MHPSSRAIALWLFVCCVMVLLMVAIGGVTRLTESGLSITRWQPLSGTFPPMNEAAWQEEFRHYQQTPEYKLKNSDMTLEGFKGIFWLEYIHRLAGRTTGVVFLLPFLYFYFSGKLQKPWRSRLLGIFLLGGIQGVVGWFMVSSGLKDAPSVNPSWLAFHLGMAMLIFALLWGAALHLWWESGSAGGGQLVPQKLYNLGVILVPLVFTQALLGAYVAGNDAGLVYNTFPLMDGHMVPNGLWTLEPWWHNFLENNTLVQFNHRLGAYVVAISCLLAALMAWRSLGYGALRRAYALLVLLVLVQFSLGVLTLLHQVPVFLGAIHQVTAIILFANVLFIFYHQRRYAIAITKRDN